MAALICDRPKFVWSFVNSLVTDHMSCFWFLCIRTRQSISMKKDLSNFIVDLWQKSPFPLVLRCACVKIKANRFLSSHLWWYFWIVFFVFFSSFDRRWSVFIAVYKLNHVKSQINKLINFALLIKISQANELDGWWPMSSWRDTFNIYHC